MIPETNKLDYQTKDYQKIIKRIDIYLSDVKKRMGVEFDIEELSLYGSTVSTEHKLNTVYKSNESDVSDIDVYIELSNLEISNEKKFNEYYGEGRDFLSMINYEFENSMFMDVDEDEILEIELTKLIKVDAHEIDIRKIKGLELDLNISNTDFKDEFPDTKRIILDNSKINFNIEVDSIDKNRFNQGECTQMAVALKDYFPQTQYGIIQSLVVSDDIDDIDEPEDRYWYEACHVVLIVDEKHYIDVDGLNKFNPDNELFQYMAEQEGNKSEMVLIKDSEFWDGAEKNEKNEYGVKSKEGNGGVERVFYGQDCKTRPENLEYIKDAKEYLKQNTDLISKIKKDIKELTKKKGMDL